MRTRIAAITLSLLVSSAAFGQETRLELCRHQCTAPRRQDERRRARETAAEGECLAGIKTLNALPMDEFQPNIEWLNIRTQAMLALARPCEVLAMLEAAHDALETSNAPKFRQ